MPYDFKREFKALYQPKTKPTIVTVPKMNFMTISGKGDPNQVGGEYQAAVEMLYSVAYALKMSYKTDYQIDGFFQYVVPPLEGFWWQSDVVGVDYTNKSSFQWLSLMRLPDFITATHLNWAKEKVADKKQLDCSKIAFQTIDEGLCVQIMHIGPFEDEPQSIAVMNDFLAESGYQTDINELRHHHEIYLSNINRVAPAKWKTVLRHPIKERS